MMKMDSTIVETNCSHGPDLDPLNLLNGSSSLCVNINTTSQNERNNSENVSDSISFDLSSLLEGYPIWSDVALVSLFCSIIAGTVAGNTLVIAAVITTRRLRTVTNCFVMSLAVADWLVGVFVMPPKVALFLVQNAWKLGQSLCEIWIALDILLCTASILSLCAISIDRYLAITRPLAYSRRRRSKRLALSMISCVWVAAAIITSPPILGWFDKRAKKDAMECEYNDNTGYVVYSALGSFFLPLLVMLYVYARIACVIARRQNSIQRLANSSDKKSHCCGGGGNDVDEPLHGRMQDAPDDIEAQRGETSRSCKYRCSPPSDDPMEDGENVKMKTMSAFWNRFPFTSCTNGNEDGTSATKRTSCRGQRGMIGSSESDTNSGASGIAISLPDPATLLGGPGSSSDVVVNMMEEIGVNDTSIPRSSSGRGIGGGSPRGNKSDNSHLNLTGLSHGHALNSIPSNSRLRTGSRLCHHSVATTSPQRNIHRIIHQTNSSTTRLYHENELMPLEGSKSHFLSKSAPRVWTVEETSSCSNVGGGGGGIGGGGGTRLKSLSSFNGRSTSFKLERNGRSTNRGNCTNLTVPMSNSPAGNPASLMSSPNANSPVDASASGSTRSNTSSSNRMYHHHQQSNHYHHHQQQHNHQHHHQNNIHRGRSIKITMNTHGNDHNQNGSTIAREFSSGRVASFKRETKTAQTLAAVVGGFIICWLPFFVAYVIGPFIPAEIIPSALMDALIWLGWSNSTINPFIYAFYSPDFRSAFWRLTVKKCSSLFRARNTGRRSPRRYDDHNNTQSRVST